MESTSAIGEHGPGVTRDKEQEPFDVQVAILEELREIRALLERAQTRPARTL